MGGILGGKVASAGGEAEVKVDGVAALQGWTTRKDSDFQNKRT